MDRIKDLKDFVNELENANLIDVKIDQDRLEILANRFLTGQKIK